MIMKEEDNKNDDFLEAETLPPIYAADQEQFTPPAPAEEGTQAEDSEQASLGDEEIPDEQMRQRLIDELDRLVERLQAITPGYVPPPFTPQGMIGLVEKNLGRFSPEMGLALIEKLRSSISQDCWIWTPGEVSGTWSIIPWSIRPIFSSGAYPESTRLMSGVLTRNFCRWYCRSSTLCTALTGVSRPLE
jgi:hypothetical protein